MFTPLPVRLFLYKQNKKQNQYNSIIGSCPICYLDPVNINKYYRCSHNICTNCHNLWMQSNQQN